MRVWWGVWLGFGEEFAGLVDAVGAGGLVGIEGLLEGGLSGVFAAGSEFEPEVILFGVESE